MLLCAVILLVIGAIVVPTIIVHNVSEDLRESKELNRPIMVTPERIAIAAKLAYLPWQKSAYGNIAQYQIGNWYQSKYEDSQRDEIAKMLIALPTRNVYELLLEAKYADIAIKTKALDIFSRYLRQDWGSSLSDADITNIEKIYDDATWMGRSDVTGSAKYSNSEVERWFECAIEFVKKNRVKLITKYIFEYSKFLSSLQKEEKAVGVLVDGEKYVGDNFDRDGSLLHELGRLSLRRSLRLNIEADVNKSIEILNRAIEAKIASGNHIVPLYSRKIVIEAKLHMQIQNKNAKSFDGILKDYEVLVVDMTKKISEPGVKSSIWEVYLGKATVEMLLRRYDESRKTCIMACKILATHQPQEQDQIQTIHRFMERLP